MLLFDAVLSCADAALSRADAALLLMLSCANANADAALHC
jgi:hypothetical protein